MKAPLLAAALVFGANTAIATEFDAAARAFLQTEIAGWTTDPVLIDALRAQNGQTRTYTADQIQTMDLSWRAEVGQSATPTIDPVLQNPAADFLRSRADASAGRITEILLMDAVGLNVAVTHVTSDFWQGDEDKHIQTFGIGPDAIHIGDIEFDESSQSYQAQISVTVTDPATGEALGAITVGVNADALM